jgi:hypothetical protein
MTHSLTGQAPDPHRDAQALAGGGAGQLLAHVPAGARESAQHALRGAFATGLDTAAVFAGVVGLVAGVLVLLLVRSAPQDGPRPSAPAQAQEAPAAA